MKFVIRDDDLNYFSTQADIERWYSDIFAQNIPVGFSTIPFVKGTSDVYPRNGEDREFPISDNPELVEYVKGNDLMEILQHGCTHETIEGVYEYAQDRDLLEDTMRGKAELERVFGKKMKIFVPPHDWINKWGIKAIEEVGLDIIRGRGTGFKNFHPSWSYVKNMLIMISDPIYPFILDFGKHKEMRSFRLEDLDVFEGLEHAHNKNGIFVVVTHLHYYTEEKKQKLVELIDKAREYGAEFVRPSSIFS